MAVGETLWSPPADAIRTSRLGDFIGFVRQTRGRDFADYATLWEWSVSDLAGFWSAIWDYFEVIAHAPYTGVLSSPTMPGARWFEGATLNYAEHVLRGPGPATSSGGRYRPGVDAREPIVLAYSQTRSPITLTSNELREQVRRARAGLRRLGVSAGDRVAAYAPNIPETFVLMLATASLGAVFSSCAPEFGTRSVVDRWVQIEPTVLFAVDGYRYGEKPIDRLGELDQIRAALPSLRHTVLLGYLDPRARLPGTTNWADLVADTEEPLAFVPVPFAHPLYVLYSSGTTGLPKPIVHGHGGILLEHLKNLALQKDLGPGDRFFWFSTTGWMMWNFLVSGPAVGAAIVLFDGDPGYPDIGGLWRLAEQSGMTYFGTSAPFLLACRKAGIVPRELADLSKLRAVGSTGAPLPPEGYRWVYEAVADGVQLHSISGGTDVCTAFVGASPLLPVVEGKISCRCLGAKVEAFDPAGQPVVGEVGELVITAPMPSMPVCFWNDHDGSRYREAYFDVFPGVWRHGDWVIFDEDGSCVISGRSDATLNRGGVRLGTSEFYAVVESLDEVVDSLVVHLEDGAGGSGELLLFVTLAGGLTLDDALRARIARELRSNLSPRHTPDKIYQVRAVPRTLSGKKLEVPVKRILTGTEVDAAAARGALANPESLTPFVELAKERGNPG